MGKPTITACYECLRSDDGANPLCLWSCLGVKSAKRPPLWMPLKSLLCVLTVLTAGLNLGDGWLTCFRPHLRVKIFFLTEREKRRCGESGAKLSSVTGHNQGLRLWDRSGFFPWQDWLQNSYLIDFWGRQRRYHTNTIPLEAASY